MTPTLEGTRCDVEYEDEDNEDGYDLWPSEDMLDLTSDEDPLDRLSSDEAVWAYQRMPHDDLPQWEPKPIRPWLEPLVRLIGIGVPVLAAWQQGKPLVGPLPEPRQSGLVVDEPWRRVYASINTMENREPLIVAMKQALDEGEQSPEIQEGGYAGELHRGRKLVQRLEESALEALDEVLAREVLDYLMLSDLIAIRSEKSTRDAASLDVTDYSCNEGAGQSFISGVPGDVDGKDGHVASGGGVTAPLVSVVVAGAAGSVGRPVVYESIAELQEAAPSAVSALAAAVRSATSSNMLRKTALGSLAIGVSAGVYGLYKWIMGANESGSVGMENNYSSTKQGIEQKPSEHQQEEFMALFEQLDVPYLDFLFKWESRELDNAAQASWYTNQTESEEAGTPVRPGDDLEYRMGVQEQINKYPETQDLIIEPLGAAIFEQLKSVVNLSPEIERAKWLPKNKKDTVYLLKLIEVADIYSREFSLVYRGNSVVLTLNRLVARLRAIAEALPGEFAVAGVAAFKRFFGWDGLNAQSKAPVDDMRRARSRRSHVISDADEAEIDPVEAIKQHGEAAADDVKLSYDDILYLDKYIDSYINNSLSEFNREKSTHFTKHDLVTVTLYKTPDGVTLTHRKFSEHIFSMRDIVTGRYLLLIKESLVNANFDKADVVEQYSSDTEKELVGWLWQRDLQVSMLSSLTNYRGEDGRAKRHALSRTLENRILIHCLKYLDSPLRRPGFAEAVKSFAEGSEIGQEVLFKGIPLYGLFFIPYGMKSGVLFNVDDGTFFHIDEVRAFNDPDINRIRGQKWRPLDDKLLPQVPKSSEFRDFILKRLSLTDYEQHRNASFNNGATAEYTGYNTEYKPHTPFSFRNSVGMKMTADIAIFNNLRRLESDIDRIVYSPGEEAEVLHLETIKRYLFISSLFTSAFIPSTGSALFRACMWLANLALDVAYVVAALRQSQIVDDPGSAEAYLNEAIIAGTVSGLVNLKSGVRLGASGVRKALHFFGKLKGAESKGIAALSAKMNWNQMSFHDKREVLAAALEGTADGIELAGLSSYPHPLKRLIRGKRPELTGDFDSDLAIIQRDLRTEVVRLRSVEPRRMFFDMQPTTLPDEMRSYLSEFEARPGIRSMMLRPSENCEAILPEVVNFMREKGLQKIKYRGMFIWENGRDPMPSSHFVALGSKGGEEFVFDLTAAQFANRGMPSLSEPLILPEAAWAQRYHNAATTKLMKYKDFDKLSDARFTFGSIQRPLPTEPMNRVTVLAEPRWYREVRVDS
ncbi:hypothetical protein [Aeromonas jandaei]|uniref:hypothetical protein n=1 Tax=Aeromonas jandaei TaxID=650 RepID=UPI003B9E0967